MYCSLKDASEKYGVKVRTLRSWIAKEKLAYKKNEIGRIFVDEKDLKKLSHNFKVVVSADGYKTDLIRASRGENGKIKAVFYKKINGEMKKVLSIKCYKNQFKNLVIEVVDGDKIVYSNIALEK